MLRVAVGEGLTGWVAQHNATIRLGDAASRPPRPPGRRAPRRGVDAARPDDLRARVLGRHRRVQGGLRPVRRGRRADARDLRGLRGPGDGQRRGVRAGPPPAAGAPPPAREPAPPARGQRAAPGDARPDRRARDDRGLAQGGRDLRLAHDLPRRPGGLGPPGRRRPRPVRRRDPASTRARSTPASRAGSSATREARPRQRRPPRPAVDPDPGHARGAGVDDRLPAARRRARSSARSTSRGWAARRRTSARTSSSSSSCSRRRRRSRCATPRRTARS